MLMLTRLRRWLAAPVFADEEKTRIARLLNLLLLAIIFIMLLDAALLLLLAPETLPTFWTNGVIVLAAWMSLWVMRRGKVGLAGGLMCLVMWPVTAYYIAISGGLQSPALGFLGIFIVVGVTLFGVQGAVGFGLLNVVAVGSLYLAGSRGLLTSIEGPPTLARLFATTSAVFCLLALIVAVSGRGVQDALTRARRGERTLAERNRELQRRDAILEAVSVAVGQLLNASDWRQEIHKVMEILGKADEADRAAIFQAHREADGVPRASLRYEWDAPGVATRLGDPLLQNTNLLEFGYGPVLKRLTQRQAVSYHTRDHPQGRRAILESTGTLSVLHLPVFLHGVLWGSLSLSMTSKEREWSRPEIGALQIAADMLGTVMERKQSEDALQQYASRLRILYQIDQAILAAASPQEIAQAAVGHIRQLIPCRQATVGVFDFEANQYIRLAADVTGEPMAGIGVSYPLEADWLDAIRQGQAFLNADLRTLPDLPPGVKALLDRGVRSLAVVPLVVRGELFGSLNLLANEPDAFAEESIEIAREVAGQLAIAIQQARLFATERDQRTLAEALRDTASGLTSTLDPDVVMARILENVGRVVQHSAANIMLIEGDSARVVYRRGYADDQGFHEAPIGLDLSNLRRMIETGLPLVIADTASDPGWQVLPNATWVRSYASAPLRVRGVVIGFLNLDSATPGFFTALHAERLQAFADQAAIAIENSQLYDRLRRHAAELEQRVAERTRYLQVVAEVSRQITTVLEIDRLLPQLVERTLKAFDLYDASVFLVDETRQVLRYKAGARLAGQHNQADEPSFAMPDPSAVARAALAREPVSITNAARSEDTFGTPEATDTRSELALPMIIGQQVLGVLDLRSRDVSRFTPEHVHILTSLAEQMGIAVRNAQLFGELEKAQRESEILYRVSRAVNATTSYPAIIRALLDQIGVVDYSIALGIYENYSFERATYTDVMAMVAPGQTEVTEPNQRFPLYVLSADEAGVSAVNDMEDRAQVDERTAVFFRGLGIEVLLSATIAMGQRQIGWFAFFSDKPRRFTDFERRIIRGMADLAAAAIERSRLFAEAQAGQKAAEEANRVKSRFLANMSHELRTPLNAILNFTAFVADGLLGPINARQAEALHQSGASGKHLLSLINDILDLTKIEVGLMDLFIQEVDLNEALAVTVSVARGLVKDKPLELRTEIEEELPHTFGDKRRIHQVFLNLVSNAIKFTPQGSITIRASHEGNRVYVSISDTGIGIAPEDQSLIFESFRQARHDLPEVSGTGLGLPISKFFVEAHGGVLRLESVPGKGSTFYVEFPIRSKEEADAANRAILPGG